MRYSPYPAYKPSRLPWLAEIPNEWGIHRLKWSVTGCDNGVWGEEPDGGEDDIVCLRVADFDRNSLRVSTSSLTVRSVDARQRGSRKINKHDLLLEKSGGGEKQLVGCVVHFDHDFDAVCSNFVARMVVAAGLSPRFWSYVHAALYAGKLNYLAIKQTTGIQNLDSGEYLNTLVAYPSEVEQVQIAAFLDWKTGQIDALIAKKQALIEKLEEKRLAVITQAVTKGLDPSAPLQDSGISWLGKVPSHWLLNMKLGFLAASERNSFVNGPFGSDLLTSELVNEGVPVIYSGDVKAINFQRKSNKYVTEAKAQDLEFCRVDGGDILLAKVGDPPGDACVYPIDEQSAVVTQDVVRIRLDTDTSDSDFLSFLLISALGRHLVKLVSVEATRGRFSLADLKSLRFPVPYLQEQKQIAKYLKEKLKRVESVISVNETAIARLTEYRTALITATTTGQIDVRNVAIPAHA